MAYTTESKVLHRARLVKTDVAKVTADATAIISECIADAEASINAITKKKSGWDGTEDYYASIQAAATNLAASYLFQQDIAARAVGRMSEEILIDRATQLYNRAMKNLDDIPKEIPFVSAEAEED